MKYYYLLNGKIMSANDKMPAIEAYKKLYELHHYNSIFDIDFKNWKLKLKPLDFSEIETKKMEVHFIEGFCDFSTPIEVTDIVADFGCDHDGVWRECLKFKQPKQVEEIEAVEFAAYLSVNNWESSNGIMYNKFRIEYGSKYIVTTEHIKQLYEIFKNQK